MKNLILFVLLIPSVVSAHPQDQIAVCVRDLPEEFKNEYRAFWHERHPMFSHDVSAYAQEAGRAHELHYQLDKAPFVPVFNIMEYYDSVPGTPICDLGMEIRRGKITLEEGIKRAKAHVVAAKFTRAVWFAETFLQKVQNDIMAEKIKKREAALRKKCGSRCRSIK